MKKKKTIIKSEKLKNKKVNYRAFVIPLFALITLNLVLSIGLNLNANTKAQTSQPTNVEYVSNVVATKQGNESAINIFNQAYKNLLASKNVNIKAEGNVNSVVNQKITITKMYNGTTHFVENINTGFKTNASRIYFNKANNNEVVMLKGTQVKNTTANFAVKPINMTYAKFKQTYSLSPDTYLPYNVSAITITSASQVATAENGNYTFTLKLHPTLATKEYGDSLKKTLSLRTAPEFNEVNLTVTVDKSYNFNKIAVVENFDIKWLGIKMNCNNTFVFDFDFAKKVVIPSIN